MITSNKFWMTLMTIQPNIWASGGASNRFSPRSSLEYIRWDVGMAVSQFATFKQREGVDVSFPNTDCRSTCDDDSTWLLQTQTRRNSVSTAPSQEIFGEPTEILPPFELNHMVDGRGHANSIEYLAHIKYSSFDILFYLHNFSFFSFKFSFESDSSHYPFSLQICPYSGHWFSSWSIAGSDFDLNALLDCMRGKSWKDDSSEGFALFYRENRRWCN